MSTLNSKANTALVVAEKIEDPERRFNEAHRMAAMPRQRTPNKKGVEQLRSLMLKCTRLEEGNASISSELEETSAREKRLQQQASLAHCSLSLML